MTKMWEVEFENGECMQVSGLNPISALANWAQSIHEQHSYHDIVRISFVREQPFDGMNCRK